MDFLYYLFNLILQFINNNQYSNLLYRKISFNAISNSYSATTNLCSVISNALNDMSNIHL